MGSLAFNTMKPENLSLTFLPLTPPSPLGGEGKGEGENFKDFWLEFERF
jgi:hypothetical protein